MRGAERVRRFVRLGQRLAEQLRATRRGGCGVVQLVGQTGSQSSERCHLVDLHIRGGEQTRTVEHRVDQRFDQRGTFPNHLGEEFAANRQCLDRLGDFRLSH